MPVLDGSENKQAKNPNHERKLPASQRASEIGSAAVEVHLQMLPHKPNDGLSGSLGHT